MLLHGLGSLAGSCFLPLPCCQHILHHAHINPDSYNIVLQGDITKIVEMTPVERRMIIEEISGIRIYEEKKQKALNELQKVE
ncbi:MAG: hypothetical protein ABGX05_04795, partial [Pirellulaceae bacterium]